MHWTTTTEFVDIETGEALTERHLKNQLYIKLKLITKYKNNGKNGKIRQNLWVCEKNKQLEFKL